MIVGLAGYAKAGKDTFAGILVENRGFIKLSFAEVLRDCMVALNPIVGSEVKYVETSEHSTRRRATVEEFRYADVIADIGYNQAKEDYPEIRDLLQRMGTEVGRNLLGANVWVEAAMRNISPNRDYVCTDMRFPNEYVSIVQSGGITVRIKRPGFGPVNNHPSETAIDDEPYDFTFTNDGTVGQFEAFALKWVDHIFSGDYSRDSSLLGATL